MKTCKYAFKVFTAKTSFEQVTSYIVNRLVLFIACTLMSSSLEAQVYYIDENFNSLSAGSTLPSGWTNDLISGSASFDFFRFGQTGVFNSVGNPGTRTSGNASVSGICAIFDSDNTSSGGGLENVALTSPSFNTTGAANLYIKWDQDYHGGYQSGDSINVEVFDGTSWIKVYQYGAFSTTGAAAIVNSPDIDVTSVLANKTNCKVRFRFRSNWSWWWMFDNIQVYSMPTTYYFIKEPFTTASGATPPSGWTNNLISGSSSFDFFRFGQSGVFNSVGNPATRTASSPIDGVFALFDSDNTSSGGGLENVALESPIVNTTGFTSDIHLKWDQFYRGGYQAGDSINVEVFDGTSWVKVYQYGAFATDGSAQIQNSPDVDVTSLIANKSNVRVRFRFRSNWSWWWIIDNVELYAPAPTPIPNFTINNASQCLPGNSFNFTNTSTIAGAGSSMTYSWNFGDLTNSTATSPSGKTYASANTYTVTLTATSNEGISASTSKTVTVNPVVTASVSIASSAPSNITCPGTSVTFTATPTNGGTAPVYEWKKNGGTVGANSATYIDAGLVNGDQITCQMTSNYPCPTGGISIVNSNTITMTVNPVLTPSVSIGVSPSNSFCPGTNATFTATSTNGGATPAYQWKKNGNNVGTNSATYSDNTLTTGDVIICEMTSNYSCPTGGIAVATSNGITINTSFPASVSIAINTATTVCSGIPVTFTATPTNGGTESYQWKKNGGNVGTNSNVFTDIPGNGDSYNVQMTSSIACASPKPATSNTISMNVIPSVVASVSIGSSAVANTICNGTSVTFTATPMNGGGTPVYQWKKNGNNVGTNSTTYVDGALVNGDQIVCEMISNATCVATPTVNSNTITITVNPIPSVNTVSNQSVCSGTNTAAVNFSGSVSSTTYSWTNNNTAIGLAASGTGNISAFAAANAGTSSITGTITVTPSANGCTGTSTSFDIVVKPKPTVNTITNQSICNGANTAAVTFGGTISGTTYSWANNTTSIGLGASGTGNISAFAGTNTGATSVTGTITVTPSAASCTGTAKTFDITVKPTPTVNAITSQSVCNGTNTTAVSFTGAVTSTTYSWTNNTTSIGLGASGTGNISAFAATNTGTSSVTGTITVTPAAASCTGSSKTFDITVKPTPTVNAITNQSVCNGDNTTAVSFTGAVSGTTYSWTNNTTSIGLSASGTGNIGAFAGTNSGSALVTGTITVTPSANSCSGTAKTFDIAVKPTPTVNAITNKSVCNGANLAAISFSGAVTGTTYSWTNNTPSIGLAASGTGNISAFVAVNPGSTPVVATVVVTPTASGCVGSTKNFTITVNPTIFPAISITSDAPSNAICASANVVFTATVVNEGATPVYQWKKNGVNTGSNSLVYSDNGLKNGDVIVCSLTSSVTCPSAATISSNSIPMTVNMYVYHTIEVTSDAQGDTLCGSNSATFSTVITNGGSAPIYEWKKNGVIVGTNSSTYSDFGVSNGDNIICSLTTNIPCPAATTVTNSNLVTMKALPVVSVGASITGTPTADGVLFRSQVTNGGPQMTYQWTKNNMPIPGAVHDSLFIQNIAMTDEVRVVVDHNLRCATTDIVTSNALTKKMVTGVDDNIRITDEFILYPNPNKGQFVVKGPFNSKELSVEVLNAVGQVIYRTQVLPMQSEFKVNIGEVPQGAYLLRFESDNQTLIKRFIVQ